MKSQDKSKQIYQEHEILRSTKKDCEKFTETLLNPLAPNSKLIKAFKRYQKKLYLLIVT